MMAPGKNRYFIALVLPPPYSEQAREHQYHFRDRYHSKASINSPPHITLHMPFEWKQEKEDELIDTLRSLSRELRPVPVELRDFGCFAPRVIFVHVTLTSLLAELQHKLKSFCKSHLRLLNAEYRDLPFHPHVTIAFRDLKKPMYAKAWEEYKGKSFTGDFTADRLVLLKHNGKSWDVLQEFKFDA